MANVPFSKKFVIAGLLITILSAIILALAFTTAHLRYTTLRELETSSKAEIIAAADNANVKFLRFIASAGSAVVFYTWLVGINRRNKERIIREIYFPTSTAESKGIYS
jgi:hypothetical protein